MESTRNRKESDGQSCGLKNGKCWSREPDGEFYSPPELRKELATKQISWMLGEQAPVSAELREGVKSLQQDSKRDLHAKGNSTLHVGAVPGTFAWIAVLSSKGCGPVFGD